MGNILGDLFGANEQATYDQKAADQSLTGFNWLTQNPQFQSYLSNGSAANSQIGALLGLGGDSGAANKAFQSYLGSTGYNFQLQQGQNAIGSSAASKGLLNSGATAKALTGYGQGLASQSFNNYLGQLGGLSNSGLQAGEATGQAGTTGGGNAAGYTQGIGQAWSQGINNAIGGAGSIAGMFI